MHRGISIDIANIVELKNFVLWNNERKFCLFLAKRISFIIIVRLEIIGWVGLTVCNNPD